MRCSSRYGIYDDKWQVVNWRKAKRLYRYERRFYRQNTTRHGHRGYLKIVPGTDYAACTLWSGGIDDSFPIATQIKHIGDDPSFEFHNPADYPDIPAKQVEDANVFHRREYRTRMAVMTELDFKYLDSISRACAIAEKRMKISKAKRSNHGNVVIDGVGGFMRTTDVVVGSSHAHFVSETVVDLMLARAAKNYDLADAIKREIVYAAQAQVLIAKDGVEFIL